MIKKAFSLLLVILISTTGSFAFIEEVSEKNEKTERTEEVVFNSHQAKVSKLILEEKNPQPHVNHRVCLSEGFRDKTKQDFNVGHIYHSSYLDFSF